MLAYDWQDDLPLDDLPEHPPANDNLEAGILAVTPEDVEAVKSGFWRKLAESRPHIGRLGRARELVKNVVRLFEILIDPSYAVPWRTTAGIVFALAYFISSLDVIPDAIPVLGFLDDAFVVAEIAFMFAADIKGYEDVKRQRAKAKRAA